MSNYPDGTWAGDPNAPWNAVEDVLVCPVCNHVDDAAVYEGEVCPECEEGIMHYGQPEHDEPCRCRGDVCYC